MDIYLVHNLRVGENSSSYYFLYIPRGYKWILINRVLKKVNLQVWHKMKKENYLCNWHCKYEHLKLKESYIYIYICIFIYLSRASKTYSKKFFN